MKQLLSIILILWTALSAHAQDMEYFIPEPKSIPAAELPKEISYKGEFLTCTVWTDKLGENYLVTSQSPMHEEEPPDAEVVIYSKEIYAKHYVRKGNTFSVLWQLYDFLKDAECILNVDYLCPPYINDLDNDGVCETWLLYQLGCRAEFSPIAMKLIMHSGAKKSAIRGERDALFPRTYPLPSILGTYRMDDNYKALPAAVRDFGIILWHKFQVEELE